MARNMHRTFGYKHLASGMSNQRRIARRAKTRGNKQDRQHLRKELKSEIDNGGMADQEMQAVRTTAA